MPNITPGEVNAWADRSKLSISSLDSELETSIATQVLARIGIAYDVSSWATVGTTPSIIRKIIAMKYMGWYYQRVYSEDADPNNYGLLLIGQADTLIEGIVAGDYPIPGGVTLEGVAVGTPAFYPNDLSTASEATSEDMSLGPNRFSMGQLW